MTRPATDAWPDDAKEWLRHIGDQAVSLRNERQELLARIRDLTDQLRRAQADSNGARTRTDAPERASAIDPVADAPQRWIADITESTVNVLRSGQEVADEIVRRGRLRAAEMEREAVAAAADTRRKAEVTARAIMAAAHDDAAEVLEGARASADELIARTQELRKRAVAELSAREVALLAEVEELELRRRRLLDSYVGIKDGVDQAIATTGGSP